MRSYLLSLYVSPLVLNRFSLSPLPPVQTRSYSAHSQNQTKTQREETRQRQKMCERLAVLLFLQPTCGLRHDAKQWWNLKFLFVLCDWSKPPTMLLPLQTTTSIFLEKKSSALSIIIGCLPLWPSPFWLHSCRPVASC